MFNSWNFGNLAGIGIHLHWAFFLLPAVVIVQVLASGGGIAPAVCAVFFVLAISGCVVLHELGHALKARRFGIATFTASRRRLRSNHPEAPSPSACR